jgi:hypothetical protein
MTDDPCQREHEEWLAALNEQNAARLDYEPFLSVTPIDGLKDVKPLPPGFMEVAQRYRTATEWYSEKERAYFHCLRQHNREPKSDGAVRLALS